MDIHETNFWIATEAIFEKTSKPEQIPNFISGEGSEYVYTPEGVIRTSNHWGKPNTCDWRLKGHEHLKKTKV